MTLTTCLIWFGLPIIDWYSPTFPVEITSSVFQKTLLYFVDSFNFELIIIIIMIPNCNSFTCKRHRVQTFLWLSDPQKKLESSTLKTALIDFLVDIFLRRLIPRSFYLPGETIFPWEMSSHLSTHQYSHLPLLQVLFSNQQQRCSPPLCLPQHWTPSQWQQNHLSTRSKWDLHLRQTAMVLRPTRENRPELLDRYLAGKSPTIKIVKDLWNQKEKIFSAMINLNPTFSLWSKKTNFFWARSGLNRKLNVLPSRCLPSLAPPLKWVQRILWSSICKVETPHICWRSRLALAIHQNHVAVR